MPILIINFAAELNISLHNINRFIMTTNEEFENLDHLIDERLASDFSVSFIPVEDHFVLLTSEQLFTIINFLMGKPCSRSEALSLCEYLKDYLCK